MEFIMVVNSPTSQKKRFAAGQIAVLLILVSTTGNLLAQSNFRFGLSATPLVSWYKIDNPAIVNEGVRMGFQYGLLTDILLEETGRYAFSSGVLVTMNGGQLTDNRDTGFSVNDVNRLQYLEIPVTMKLTATELNYFKFFGQIGVVPGFNIRARGDRSFDPTLINNPDVLNRKVNEINIFNIGLQVGGGIDYELAESLSLSGGIYYRNGFVNLYDDGDKDKITLNQLALVIALFF